jgi:hypothetical protein
MLQLLLLLLMTSSSSAAKTPAGIKRAPAKFFHHLI